MAFLSLLTMLKVSHLVGLVTGLGGAILADFTIFTRGVIRPVSPYTVHQAKFLSRIVSFGLIMLWLTGAGLIWVNILAHPEYLTNQKLWAKIFIVIMLTINGVFVHKLALSHLQKSMGSRLFDNTGIRQIAMLTFLGAVSLVSWTMPFVLGKASELNYVTPMWVIVLVYATCVLAAWLGMFAVMSSIRRIQNYLRKVAELTLQPSAQWEQMRAWDKLKLAA